MQIVGPDYRAIIAEKAATDDSLSIFPRLRFKNAADESGSPKRSAPAPDVSQTAAEVSSNEKYSAIFQPDDSEALITSGSSPTQKLVNRILFPELAITWIRMRDKSPGQFPEEESIFEYSKALSSVFADKVAEHLNTPKNTAERVENNWMIKPLTEPQKPDDTGFEVYHRVGSAVTRFAVIDKVAAGFYSKLEAVLPAVLQEMGEMEQYLQPDRNLSDSGPGFTGGPSGVGTR